MNAQPPSVLGTNNSTMTENDTTNNTGPCIQLPAYEAPPSPALESQDLSDKPPSYETVMAMCEEERKAATLPPAYEDLHFQK